DGRGCVRPRLARSRAHDSRDADLDPASGRGPRAHLLGRRGGTPADGRSMTTYSEDAPASAALLARAVDVTPGGVNSPVRAFRAVGGTPRFMVSGRGPYSTDPD